MIGFDGLACKNLFEENMKKIIMVDNNGILTILFEEIFRDKFEVLMTKNVAETSQILLSGIKNIDLIISDFYIQEGETAEELFNCLRSSGHDKIPVLIYSGYNEDRRTVESYGGMFALIPEEFNKFEKIAIELLINNNIKKMVRT